MTNHDHCFLAALASIQHLLVYSPHPPITQPPRMPIPTVRRCCLCLDLKTGTMILGIYNMAGIISHGNSD